MSRVKTAAPKRSALDGKSPCSQTCQEMFTSSSARRDENLSGCKTEHEKKSEIDTWLVRKGDGKATGSRREIRSRQGQLRDALRCSDL
nr:hypothetical protein BgiMline_028787 [Biomphalaria glabrata]